MDPRDWVEVIFAYGPYALLALFVLWVGPKQTKVFLDCKSDPVVDKIFCCAIAAVCWAVGFGSVAYLYLYWPPKAVYEGSFGAHSDGVQFFTFLPNIYLAASQLEISAAHRDIDGRRLWKYAVVSQSHSVDKENKFDFTYQWGTGTDEFTDYIVAISQLTKRRLDLYPDRKHPGKLF